VEREGSGLLEQAGFLIASGIFWGVFFWLWSRRDAWLTLLRSDRGRLTLRFRPALKDLIELYHKRDESSEWILLREIRSSLSTSDGRSEQEAWENLLAVIELRRIMAQRTGLGKKALQEAFIFRKKAVESEEPDLLDFDAVGFEEIGEAAAQVAHLYWKVLRVASSKNKKVAQLARDLLQEVFGRQGSEAALVAHVESVIDAIQRYDGVPFLVLNLIQQNRWSEAKSLSARVLNQELALDEEHRACLYWMTELTWFQRNHIAASDFESSIRYLYHLTFTNPERVGFLEIDSQFFSQFDTVTELAKEGFLFKEVLIDRVLQFWEPSMFCFSPLFKEVLELLTGQNGKIYQDKDVWVRWWDREKEGFQKEILFLLEANLFYSARDYHSALLFVDKALAANPHFKPALLNRLFCLAQLGKTELHTQAVQEVLQFPALLPRALSVIGNSYLLLGNSESAQTFYQQLASVEGWERKTDYYQSTFCFEHGLFEQALEFAQKAHAVQPGDLTLSFHLSQCLSAVGKKHEALEILQSLEGKGPQWLNFYRFTLERDSGLFQAAHLTLSQIPSDYFDDPEELAAAVDFAKNTSDLNLLRRLKAQR